MLPSRPDRRLRLALAAAATIALAAGFRLRADDKVVSPTPLSPAGERMKADVSYFADDLREGRGPGTSGLDASADHIAQTFRELGLKPAPGADGYFQNFTFPGDMAIKGDSSLMLKGPENKELIGDSKADFTPMTARGLAFETLPIVFAGYGITARDEKLKLDYDDYSGIDAEGKIVLILRGEPQAEKEDSLFGGKENTTYATFQHKATNAVSHKAKALLIVNDIAHAREKDTLMAVGSAAVNSRLPMIMITRDFADRILAGSGSPRIAELEKAIDTELKPQSKVLDGWKASAKVDMERRPFHVKNVIGVLEGSGPLADETIVVGAHYDHLGKGDFGSLSMGSHDIHNGADDNASGTSTMMEMARRLARRGEPLGRRVVFMAYSGEERGLLGSIYYVNHPLYPLKETVAMVNFDMVGRLNEKSEVDAFGLDSSPSFAPIVQSLGESLGLKIKNIPGTTGVFYGSDHASFYGKDIPVVFFFTGDHPDYHRPSDDTDKINFEGMTRIADLGELLLLDLAKRPNRPEFSKLSNKPKVAATTPPAAAPGAARAYFGSRPSYGEPGPGVKLDGVTEGGPAEKAGIKKGDIIIKFGDKEIEGIDAYQAALTSHKPGDEVDVVVKRDGKELTIKVKLTERPRSNSQ